VKTIARCLVFVLGLAMLIFGWYRVHDHMINPLNHAGNNVVRSSELMVVVGGLIALMAFLPSSETLSRLASTSPKRRKPAQPAHFRRRRKT
jgi:hypothetical protein